MTLDEILKPVKWVDEQVLRQYTKIGKRIPDKSLYKVTTGLHFLGNLDCAILSMPLPIIHGFIMGYTDLVLNLDGLRGKPLRYMSGDAYVINPENEAKLRFIRTARLPLFITGVSLLGKVAYDTINYFINGEPIESHTYTRQAVSGIGFISLASSMYLKDQDPKLLQKQPFWKAAYNWAKETASSLVPKPVSSPVPSASFSLEKQIADYI